MGSGFAAPKTKLSKRLTDTWAKQGMDGFLLIDPDCPDMPVREDIDHRCGVNYRFRWMPHREIRGDVGELESRGILNPERDESKLFRDERDPYGRHCFLCAENIAECHPREILLPLELAGRDYLAGANFAWIEPNHFTIMSAEHTDQHYTRHALEAMLDLHMQTAGQFRVLFNGPGAGASIPWHLHYQITTAPMPIEHLHADRQDFYPTGVCRFTLEDDGLNRAHTAAQRWLDGDAQHRSINLLIATPEDEVCLFVFPRDRRHSTAAAKGLVGGFEVAGDFVLSAPREEEVFNQASAATAHDILGEICPPDWLSSAAA